MKLPRRKFLQLSALAAALPGRSRRAWAQAYPEHGAVCNDADIRTVFTTAYRLAGLDLDDPRVDEGLRITNEVLWRAQQKADKAGVKLLVLLIPTKELVYAELTQRAGRSTGTLRASG